MADIDLNKLEGLELEAAVLQLTMPASHGAGGTRIQALWTRYGQTFARQPASPVQPRRILGAEQLELSSCTCSHERGR